MTDRTTTQIARSNFISRDLSWLKFNQRVLDQAKKPDLNFFEKLKFMAITSSNLDEFFMIRVGSLYNYLDYSKERVDYSTLREVPFKKKLFLEIREFFKDLSSHYIKEIRPNFKKNGFEILKFNELKEGEKLKVKDYDQFLNDNNLLKTLQLILFVRNLKVNEEVNTIEKIVAVIKRIEDELNVNNN